MPSNTPLTDAINALTQYANDTTGASDTTLSDAVATLAAGYGGGGGGYLYEESSTVSTNEVWNSPLMANNLATGGYLEAEVVFSAQTNYPNIISIGTKRSGGLDSWGTTYALHFFYNTSTHIFDVRQSSVTTSSQEVDPAVSHVIKVDKDYAYVDGVPVVALNSTILNASALMIGSAQGTQRFAGTFNYIRYK